MRDSRETSGLKIAATLGTVVAGVMLLIWGATAIAGNMYAEPAPAPKATPVTKLPTAPLTATATAPSEPATVPTAPPVAKPAAPVAKPKNATPPPAPAPAVPPSVKAANTTYVVVIDPGHQGKGDNRPEPIGPDSGTTKPRNTSGAAGVATRQEESMLNLQVALKIRDELQRRGVKVIMCRTTQNVTISNGERARMANEAKADLFLRVHADSVDNGSHQGFMTMVPAKNQWWGGPLLATSEKAGEYVQRSAVAATGAKDRGITHRGDMSGFNWAKVPSVLVEMGFLSNADEDRRMATPAYQQKLAEGISNGVVDYLNSSR